MLASLLLHIAHASSRQLLNSCLEPVSDSHMWGAGGRRRFVFKYTLGIGGDATTVGETQIITFAAPEGVDCTLDRVIGGYGASIVVDAFHGVDPRLRRGRVVVRLGSAPPSPPLALADANPFMQNYLHYLGGDGAAAGASAAASWLKTHGPHRIPTKPDMSADEYAATHLGYQDAFQSAARSDRPQAQVASASQGWAEQMGYQQQHGRRALATRAATGTSGKVDSMIGAVYSAHRSTATITEHAEPPAPAPRPPPAPPRGIELELQGILSGEGLPLAASVHEGPQLALLLLPNCETAVEHEHTLEEMRSRFRPAPPPTPAPPTPRPPVGFPRPPPHQAHDVTYSYDDDRTDDDDDPFDGDDMRADAYDLEFGAKFGMLDKTTGLRGGGSAGGWGADVEHKGLLELLADQALLAEVDREDPEKRGWGAAPPPSPLPSHVLHLSLSEAHDADDDDNDLQARLARLAPKTGPDKDALGGEQHAIAHESFFGGFARFGLRAALVALLAGAYALEAHPSAPRFLATLCGAMSAPSLYVTHSYCPGSRPGGNVQTNLAPMHVDPLRSPRDAIAGRYRSERDASTVRAC